MHLSTESMEMSSKIRYDISMLKNKKLENIISWATFLVVSFGVTGILMMQIEEFKGESDEFSKGFFITDLSSYTPRIEADVQ